MTVRLCASFIYTPYVDIINIKKYRRFNNKRRKTLAYNKKITFFETLTYFALKPIENNEKMIVQLCEKKLQTITGN